MNESKEYFKELEKLCKWFSDNAKAIPAKPNTIGDIEYQKQLNKVAMECHTRHIELMEKYNKN